MNVEDAITYILSWLRAGSPSRYSNYGYDIYLTNVIENYIQETTSGLSPSDEHGLTEELFPVFVDAAWILCGRGIIRPGVREYQAQSTEQGTSGVGYSLTSFGRQWLQDEQEDFFVPTEPGRFASMMKPFRSKFGDGFFERSQEAIKCYGAHAFLACCSMCGAAAESILLVAAIEKVGNEEEVLKKYRTSQGRSRIENILVGQANQHLQREVKGLTELLKYWRDEASHGTASSISDNEAYTSLMMLLRFAILVNQNWQVLTR